MMRFIGAVACFSVSMNCVDKALGLQPQVLFSESFLWMWWPPALLMLVNCGLFAFGYWREASH